MSENIKSIEEQEAEAAKQQLWWMVAVWYKWRWFILLITLLTAITAGAVSWFYLPNYYTATASVILPITRDAKLSALAGKAGGVASLLGKGGDYVQYLAILSSRTIRDELIEKWHLADVYEIDEPNFGERKEKTRQTLNENIGIGIDPEYEFMTISVSDTSPQRAADMANYLTKRLNEKYIEFTSENATAYKNYVEDRYLATKIRFDSLQVEMQRFQEESGTINLPTQAEQYYKAMADLKMEVSKAEIQYKALKETLGDKAPETTVARIAFTESNKRLNEYLSGQDNVMRMTLQDIPANGRIYAELYAAMLEEGEVVKFIRPLYEQAQLEEERKPPAVQTMDTAEAPFKKAGPKRSIITIVAALSALSLSLVFLLLWEGYKRGRKSFRQNLNKALSDF
jgi:tyrosine-protein kinase Etk/Wzc